MTAPPGTPNTVYWAPDESNVIQAPKAGTQHPTPNTQYPIFKGRGAHARWLFPAVSTIAKLMAIISSVCRARAVAGHFFIWSLDIEGWLLDIEFALPGG